MPVGIIFRYQDVDVFFADVLARPPEQVGAPKREHLVRLTPLLLRQVVALAGFAMGNCLEERNRLIRIRASISLVRTLFEL
jgi:hypothetical protein